MYRSNPEPFAATVPLSYQATWSPHQQHFTLELHWLYLESNIYVQQFLKHNNIEYNAVHC